MRFGTQCCALQYPSRKKGLFKELRVTFECSPVTKNWNEGTFGPVARYQWGFRNEGTFAKDNPFYENHPFVSSRKTHQPFHKQKGPSLKRPGLSLGQTGSVFHSCKVERRRAWVCTRLQTRDRPIGQPDSKKKTYDLCVSFLFKETPSEIPF